MRILVIGDYITDIYTFGTANRLCPEAPVPVMIPQSTRESPGGAGLVQAQLVALGADAVGRFGSYSTKQRFFAGNHLVCRLDTDSIEPYWDALIEPSLDWAEIIVVSDYGKGSMTRELAEQIIKTGKPCFVDAKPHWPWYAGKNVTIFPNHHEATPVSEIPAGTFQSYEYGRVVNKLGKDGARLNDSEHHDVTIPATTTEIVDVCGAGDIFIAGFAYAWSIRLPADHCLRFANALAGESCRHLGTYVVPREFAQSALDKILSLQESEQPTPLHFPDSTLANLRRQTAQAQYDAAVAQEASGSPRVNSVEERVGISKMILDNLRHEQIHPQSPSVPTESTDVLTQADQEIDCEPSGVPPWEG